MTAGSASVCVARAGVAVPAVLLAALPGACQTAATTAAPAGGYDDPFAYCAAVGTIDKPDGRYAGPKVPDAVAQGLRSAFGMPPDAPLEPFRERTIWRCMGGEVHACNVGANLPCTEKADTSRAPTAGMAGFCQQNPGADFIPAVVTGRATVYEWRCEGGAPTVVRQLTEPDAQGYLSNVWYPIRGPEG